MRARHPSRIDAWLGRGARLLQRHEMRIAAPPPRAYDSVLSVRFAELPAVRLLFRLRGIPHTDQMTARDFFTTAPFLILEEEPGRELVFGTAGPLRLPEPVDGPDAYRAHVRPGTIKVAGNVCVAEEDGGSLVWTETWVETFGARTGWAFRLYWLVVGPFSALIRRLLLRAGRRKARAG